MARSGTSLRFPPRPRSCRRVHDPRRSLLAHLGDDGRDETKGKSIYHGLAKDAAAREGQTGQLLRLTDEEIEAADPKRSGRGAARISIGPTPSSSSRRKRKRSRSASTRTCSIISRKKAPAISAASTRCCALICSRSARSALDPAIGRPRMPPALPTKMKGAGGATGALYTIFLAVRSAAKTGHTQCNNAHSTNNSADRKKVDAK